MDLLQAIFSNNRIVADAVERSEPVLRRISGKIAARLASGGRIICLGGDSAVPGEYQKGGMFLSLPADADLPAARNDVIIAMDGLCPEIMSEQLRRWRRRGMFTVCIGCGVASAAASAAEAALVMQIDPVAESRALKERLAQQMALDALLTLAFFEAGAAPGEAPDNTGDALGRAALALMKELPALDRESAEELIERHGSVRKAAKAYLANVQGKL